MNIQIRMANPADAEAIAALHAASWKRSYRGMFSDAYLDGDVFEERQQHWRRRLQTEPRPDQGVLVALDGTALVGFLCIFLEAEPGWGPLLDNLHVQPDRKGCGIGQQLLQAGVRWLRTRGDFECWHLWVLEDNLPTRRVYEHLGWVPEARTIHRAPDGTEYPSWRYTQRLESP
jgi:GNAT superfamily N-acetyltransferase